MSVKIDGTNGIISAINTCNSIQIGQSSTASNNFTISVPTTPDGTIKIARGNVGTTTQDVLTIDASGNMTLPQ
jgi:hypothetical protein